MYTCWPDAAMRRAYGGLGGTAVDLEGAGVAVEGPAVGDGGRAVLVGAAVGEGCAVGVLIVVGEGGTGDGDAATETSAVVATGAGV